MWFILFNENKIMRRLGVSEGSEGRLHISEGSEG
jgi:hypothetical protein